MTGLSWTPTWDFLGFSSYSLDAWQRSVLFLDVMRQRQVQYREHLAQPAPHVLSFETELICDGRTLERPVNYLLHCIVTDLDDTTDPTKRPFVIVDPRAGHGPGIGGFKADSEIGVALAAGHPCYFVGFLPDPMPGQTIEDVMHAEARFLEVIAARHPEANGRPCIVGNCQAGWAVMMLAALRPELCGPLILAGSPLSYWAGVRGRNPMRYTGGVLGGSWLTALTSDLGGGIFDGAWLVQNFENQNPANTFWAKQYNLYSRIDEEAERYLGFEKWWGGHVTLNGEEMQFIVDELFVGNRLAAGEVRTSDGTAIDLRAINSPIVVFCSKGDNITPPQQALGWLLDLYDSVDDIRACGQTIVYAIHESIGHLGIFVSAGVAQKEHDQFASNIDMIDVLPPGLYEAVLTPKDEAGHGADLVGGQWLMRCEARTLDDIRALGGNDVADERRFAAAARVSEINLALYRAFAQPLVRMMVTPGSAEAFRRFHPLRLGYEIFGEYNPMIALVKEAAAQTREQRRPVATDNVFLKVQDQASRRIVDGLEASRRFIENGAEASFRMVYGAPALQAALGLSSEATREPRRAAKNVLHRALMQERMERIVASLNEGGAPAALVRALIYVTIPRRSADERSFEAIRRLRRETASAAPMSLQNFKALVRNQFFLLLLDEPGALAAIPTMLPEGAVKRRDAFAVLERIVSAPGSPTGEVAERLEAMRTVFGALADVPLEDDMPLTPLVENPEAAAPRRRPAGAR